MLRRPHYHSPGAGRFADAGCAEPAASHGQPAQAGHRQPVPAALRLVQVLPAAGPAGGGRPDVPRRTAQAKRISCARPTRCCNSAPCRPRPCCAKTSSCASFSPGGRNPSLEGPPARAVSSPATRPTGGRPSRSTSAAATGCVPDLPVLTTNGVWWGGFRRVGLTTSQVVLIGNPNCRVAATFGKNGENGVITGGAGPLDNTLVTLSFFRRGQL